MLADAHPDDVLGLTDDPSPQKKRDKPVPWDFHEDELLKANAQIERGAAL